ncbi:MAG: aminopeptidase P family protein [Emergencia sp.]
MRKQLTDLRREMGIRGIDAYLIPTTDFHGSEYVNDYFKCRRYISGFTGSAGTLAVTADEARLWTDGRYFLQAADQLAGSGIDLMKQGEPGVPDIPDYLRSVLAKGSRLGFDGRVVDSRTADSFEEDFELVYDTDLADLIWPERPQIRPSEIYALPETVTGESTEDKLRRLRTALDAAGADCHLMTRLEEIAWLFNLRGNDVANTPVFFAFALITREDARLYVLDETLREKGICISAEILPYLQVFEDLGKLKCETILLNRDIVSCSLVRSISTGVRIISGPNPCELMKSLKNPAEIRSTRRAHLKDGAAMAEFLFWLKTRACTEGASEISAARYLENCRRRQDGFNDISFDTIAGYQDHGAVVHYFAVPETDRKLHPEGFLLVDSGGQYDDGTTDITRTVALGPLTEEMKRHYTLVLRSHIALASSRFAAGTTGADLDRVSRRPLQEAGLDYNHGTGHGVGHLLSVHEGPQTISPRGTSQALLPGMITSNEPGVYIEGSHGIRLENEILCRENDEGMLFFETITFCPFEREAILPEMLTEEELAWLNDYHSQVFEKISPLVPADVKFWLKEAAAPILR